MNPILNSIDFIARSPGGVALMRKLVLELAVRGKLVPQDPKDEPASVLLERIKREKARLVKEGKIKAGKELPEIKEEEKPYELPRGWEWVRVRDITHDWGQKTPDSDFTYIDVASIDNKTGKLSPKIEILSAKEAPSRARKIVKVGSVIYSTVRPYLLNTAIIENPISPEPIASTAFAILHPYSFVSSQYLHLFLRSQPFTDYVSEKMIGMAYPAINDSQFSNGVIALPPLPEQSRIVARVKELMAVLDRLEDQTNKTDEERNRALTAATQAVSQAATPEEIASSWLRLATDFDRLVDRAEDVKAIRAMVLELAVRGKLVSQDPRDEPASVLLERIKREKARLVKEGKIKAGKELPEITEEERPFKLPSGWKWERLGKIVKKLTDGTHHSPINKPTGAFLYISAKNIKWTGLDLSEITYVTEEVHKEIYSRCDPEFGDILYIKDGATTGISAINTIHKPFSMLSSVALLKPSCGVLKEYLHTVLQSPYFFRLMRQGMSGVAITRITLEKLGMAPFPLAPLHEQSRILARVQELMAILDRLEEKLAAREKAAVLASESTIKMNQA